MLPEDEIREMQEIQVEAMPGSAVVLDRVPSDDGMGNEDETWTARPEPVTARRSALTPRQLAVVSDHLKGNDGCTITIPANVPIEVWDKLEMDGRTYQVVAFAARGSWETARRCLCVEVSS